MHFSITVSTFSHQMWAFREIPPSIEVHRVTSPLNTVSAFSFWLAKPSCVNLLNPTRYKRTTAVQRNALNKRAASMYSRIKVLGLTSVYEPTVKSVNNTGKTERGAASFILAPARVSPRH